MLNKEDIKVGQYVKRISDIFKYNLENFGIFKPGIEYIVSVNSQYAYTNLKNRIYPKDYKEYIALSDEEVKAESIHCLNDEVKNLLSNIKNLHKEIYILANSPYITIDADEMKEDLKDIVDRINEVLEEYENQT